MRDGTTSEQSPIEIEELDGPSRSLRIAVVTETYPPEVNGVSLSAARFVEGLRVRNHQIQLVRPRQDGSDLAGAGLRYQEVLMRGVAIPRYPNLRLGLPAKRALERLWTHRRPDVVHIVTEGPLGWSALRAALKLKIAVVSDFRTNFHAYSRHYGIGWLGKPILAYLRKFHNRTLCTMVPTEGMRAQLAALGFARLRVVGRGVDTALFHPSKHSAALRARWGAGPADPVMLHVGRLAAEKNLGTLIAAYGLARSAEPRTRLVLVGDGPARHELLARCPEAILAGTQRGEDLAVHYASGDVFAFPSLTETYGNVTMEAMASGLAVVAYEYAAAQEHIRHSHNGLLAKFGDAQAFSAQAAGLVAQPARIRAFGEQARQTALACDWMRVVVQLESVLESAAGTGAWLLYGESGIRRTRMPSPQST